MRDKSKRWYFYQGWLAAQRDGLVRMDEPYLLRKHPRGLFVKFIQEEKELRLKTRKQVWRYIIDENNQQGRAGLTQRVEDVRDIPDSLDSLEGE